MTHDELIERCRKRDRRAQLDLYRKYADGMFAIAARMVGNDADAADLTQEAFIRAFRKIEQFQGEVTFGAWLKRIVINRCLDFHKSRKQRFVPLEESRLQVSEDTNWEVDYPVSAAEVKAAILDLPDLYRSVVQLYLVEGYDHAEISDIMGIAEPTCRTRLMRGKSHLLERLKQQYHVAGS